MILFYFHVLFLFAHMFFMCRNFFFSCKDNAVKSDSDSVSDRRTHLLDFGLFMEFYDKNRNINECQSYPFSKYHTNSLSSRLFGSFWAQVDAKMTHWDISCIEFNSRAFFLLITCDIKESTVSTSGANMNQAMQLQVGDSWNTMK